MIMQFFFKARGGGEGVGKKVYYGTDVKHFVVKGSEKIRYFVTNPMQGVGWGR